MKTGGTVFTGDDSQLLSRDKEKGRQNVCKHPLKAFQIGVFPDTGKPKYKIVPYTTDHVERHRGIFEPVYTSFCSPYSEKTIKEFVEIPCGKCIDCRLQYSRMWADRCMYESYYYPKDHVWFVTLTYDPEHIIDVNHEVMPGTLVKEHLQKFFKRLRRECDYHEISDRIRYFACGEYGTSTFRPHYHIILYGINLRRIGLSEWIQSKSGHMQWRSGFLEKCWSNGLVTVSEVSWDTCAYTARYTLKKAFKNYSNELYTENNLEPEFVTMSRKPGIGFQYYLDHKDNIYEFDQIIQSSPDGGRKAKPPKYFDNHLQVDDPELYKRIKKNRKECAEYSKKIKLERTDKTYLELLEVEEKAMMSRIKALKRELE